MNTERLNLKRTLVWLAALVLVLLAVAGCNTPGADVDETPEAGANGDTAGQTEADLVAQFEEIGAEVRLSTEPIVAIDVLSIPGNTIFVNGEEIHLYIYDTAEAATEDAARISADASQIAPEAVGDEPPTIVDWDGQPHFYRLENIIVLYVGENSDVLNLLNQVLGAPIATGGQ